MTEEGLRQFQKDKLPEVDQEWHRLVPKEAREVLSKNEVRRQSVLFEIFKSEKDYVTDLELVRKVCPDPRLSNVGANNHLTISGVCQWPSLR